MGPAAAIVAGLHAFGAADDVGHRRGQDGGLMFAKREERLVFQQMQLKSSTRFPICSNMQDYVFNLIFRVR
ncbi:MAG: hypothetical protein ACLU0O_08695 [Collinsella sp.]